MRENLDKNNNNESEPSQHNEARIIFDHFTLYFNLWCGRNKQAFLAACLLFAKTINNGKSFTKSDIFIKKECIVIKVGTSCWNVVTSGSNIQTFAHSDWLIA